MKLPCLPLLATLCLTLFCNATSAAEEPLDRIVAVVNTDVVLQSELDRAIKITENQLR